MENLKFYCLILCAFLLTLCSISAIVGIVTFVRFYVTG